MRPKTLPRDETIRRARELRRTKTPAEYVLWELLRAGRLEGFKFRRQQPIGPYFADFYCPSARVVIELDGAGHEAQAEYDRERDDYMGTLGIRVLRFSNDDVSRSAEDVLEHILAALRPESRIVRPMEPSPRPSPSGRGSNTETPRPSHSGRGSNTETPRPSPSVERE